jgi:hypothetical protein
VIDVKKQLFDLGQIVATPGALAALEEANQSPSEFLARHVHGDWGMVDEHDQQANDDALRDGSRILSAYVLTTGVKIWIITEADRSSSCCLLPEEY